MRYIFDRFMQFLLKTSSQSLMGEGGWGMRNLRFLIAFVLGGRLGGILTQAQLFRIIPGRGDIPEATLVYYFLSVPLWLCSEFSFVINCFYLSFFMRNRTELMLSVKIPDITQSYLDQSLNFKFPSVYKSTSSNYIQLPYLLIN